MNKSESIGQLAEALSKAQGAMRNAVKDADNPFFKSKYADLASVADACRDELAANGLAVSQLPETKDGDVVLHYILMHASGEWLSGELIMSPVKKDPQGIGSTITYARRYSLASIAGIATEDDDGNAASGNGNGHGGVKNVQRTTQDIQLTPKSAATTPGQAVHSPSKGPKPTEAADNPSTAAPIRGEDALSTPVGLPATSPAVEKKRSKNSTAELPAKESVATSAMNAVEYISREDQRDFHAECRKAAKNRDKADHHTYTWLLDNGYHKTNADGTPGEPSASMIPVSHWPKAMLNAAKWVGVQ